MKSFRKTTGLTHPDDINGAKLMPAPFSIQMSR
jgi:hypothetical protein